MSSIVSYFVCVCVFLGGCEGEVVGIEQLEYNANTRAREYNCRHIYDKCVYVVQCHVQG